MPASPEIASNEPAKRNEIIIELHKFKPVNAPWDAKLPGSGEQPDHCGLPVSSHCNSCQKPFYATSSCKERLCPSCFELWGARQASTASRRIWAGYAKALAHGHEDVRIHHCVISFPYLGQPLEDLREQARHIARSKGSSGEAIIPHPFRNDDDLWIMDGTVHFHLIALFLNGRFSPAEKGEPFIFKVIPRPGTKNDYRGILSLKELKDLLGYQLSHAGIVPDKHTLTWSGDLAYNKLTKEDLMAVAPDPERGFQCPNCGSYDTEPCDQYDLVPTFTNQSFKDRSEFKLLQVHPYPDDPPPPRTKLVNIWHEAIQ